MSESSFSPHPGHVLLTPTSAFRKSGHRETLGPGILVTSSINDDLQSLRAYLDGINPGAIEDAGDLEGLLSGYWEHLDTGHGGGMKPDKLNGRMEDVAWDPPYLTFTIERHGGTVLGSKRGELQHWSVNVEEGKANLGHSGHRQLRPNAPRLDVRPLAEEVVRIIVSGQADDRVKRLADGRVRVVAGKVIPDDGGPKQTLQGRRKRFRADLEKHLAKHGWSTTTTPNIFVRSV